jgi:hypothetical protein
MESDQLREPWKNGKLVGQKPPLKPKDTQPRSERFAPPESARRNAWCASIRCLVSCHAIDFKPKRALQSP